MTSVHLEFNHFPHMQQGPRMVDDNAGASMACLV